MVVTIAVVLCHAVQGISAPVCHEEIVHIGESMQECILSQAALADWKQRSRFASGDWSIARIKCVPGTYEAKDAT